jgi:RNA polymerase sigma factor (sigma-70 family)
MSDSPEEDFLKHRELIESIIELTCRKRRLTGDHADEFAARAWLALVENDYARFRKFEERSSMRTYLTVVINRLFLDYLTSIWGRWRPSAVAKNWGTDAVRLEMLAVRDKLPLAQALDIVEREFGSIDRAGLETLAARFPLATRRKDESDEILEGLASRDPSPLDLLMRAEAAEQFERVCARVGEILSELEPRMRLVLKLRFVHNMKVSDIARETKQDAKRLYREIDEVLQRIRKVLESEGLSKDAVRKILETFEDND